MAVTGTFFTGCSEADTMVNDLVNNLTTGEEITDGISSPATDTLTISETDEGFLVNWVKKTSGYGEVIFTDEKTINIRGKGYPLTSNIEGDFSLDCTLGEESESGVQYECIASNKSNTQSLFFMNDTAYQWLVSYGTEHEHGEVEAVTEYSNGILTID